MNSYQILVLDREHNLFQRFKECSRGEANIADLQHVRSIDQLTKVLNETTHQAQLIVVRKECFPHFSAKRTLSSYSLNNSVVAFSVPHIDRITQPVEERCDLLIPESFSVLTFQELLGKSEDIFQERPKKIFADALDLLTQEICGQIDQVAYLKRKGYDANVSSIVLKEMCAPLQKLSDEERVDYLISLMEKTAEQPAYTGTYEVRLPYVGISNRVRKKLSGKALSSIRSAQKLLKKVG